MQTIKGPAGATLAPNNDWMTPATTFTPFVITCHTRDCRAELLVDDPEDVAYRVFITWYASAADYQLYVVCPHCDRLTILEKYGQPGNPVRQNCQSYHRPSQTYRCVPTSVRSRAYRKWESAQTSTFWEEFFMLRDVRYWAEAHPRAARKLRSRLMP